VGEVTEITLDDLNPNNVIARIRVAANTPVKADSQAELGILGITGLTFIQILAGSPDEVLLRKGINPYPPRIYAEKTQLDKLVASSGDMLATGTQTLEQLNNLFSEENLERMSSILSNIEAMTAVANEDTGLIGEARQAIRALEQAGLTINEAAVNVDKAAVEFDGNVALMTKDTLLLLKDMQSVVENANRAVVAAESVVVDDLTPQAEDVMQELAVTLQDVRLLINRLDGVVEDLERDPTTFVLGEAKPYE
jgi:phospholipid/cholesterol/gamma-HCH transport system substrate-binding protein